jgi:hypothetical protein
MCDTMSNGKFIEYNFSYFLENLKDLLLRHTIPFQLQNLLAKRRKSTWNAAVMHVTVSATGIAASRPLPHNHACAWHEICCRRPRSHHDGWQSTNRISWARCKPACRLIYVCACSFFFLCYNKGNHTMDAMFLSVCAHLYRDVCVYPGPVNMITINYIVSCYF